MGTSGRMIVCRRAPMVSQSRGGRSARVCRSGCSGTVPGLISGDDRGRRTMLSALVEKAEREQLATLLVDPTEGDHEMWLTDVDHNAAAEVFTIPAQRMSIRVGRYALFHEVEQLASIGALRGSPHFVVGSSREFHRTSRLVQPVSRPRTRSSAPALGSPACPIAGGLRAEATSAALPRNVGSAPIERSTDSSR